MKFWKILKRQIEQTLPEWRDKFLSYKNLKKQLKIMCPKDARTPPKLDAYQVHHFLCLLEVEIDKFNTFFVNKEEEYIIKWKLLQDRVDRAMDYSDAELMSLGREIVDFHGEMVLLENYSALNYTGLVKIIKKHDKRTGALLRLPFIQDVLNQPFFETDVLNSLVKECEVILNIFFANNDEPSCPCSPTNEETEEDGCGSNVIEDENIEELMQAPTELAEIENMENEFIKLTLSALRTLEEIRGRSSMLMYAEFLQKQEIETKRGGKACGNKRKR
ncbi:SPX domain-containing protein 1-like [Vicia villosa]|uniref:SPX domain-containing protein 1-like n=1 Tax=Vicia villosa TaxID=3911 RepID=UPI00273CEF81|nr:SPX domain-containing protein 1-like [Vicia villosa]